MTDRFPSAEDVATLLTARIKANKALWEASEEVNVASRNLVEAQQQLKTAHKEFQLATDEVMAARRVHDAAVIAHEDAFELVNLSNS